MSIRCFESVRFVVPGVIAVAVACEPSQGARPASGLDVSSPHGSAGAEQPPPATRTRPAARIREGVVDDIVIGVPIPPALLDNARYQPRWVADAQPMEGFLIGAPPVWVIIANGPMQDVEPGPLEELTPVLAPKALAAARAGAVVSGILIEEPGITTEQGIGVGSSYDSLRAAYGDLKLERSPEWFDSNITCDVTTKGMAGVRFLLESCEPGSPPGRVKRMLVSQP